jgi:hypothetical protein
VRQVSYLPELYEEARSEKYFKETPFCLLLPNIVHCYSYCIQIEQEIFVERLFCFKIQRSVLCLKSATTAD